MKLNLEQISSVCLGAVRVCEAENGIYMHRFTEEQEKIYKNVREDFYKESLATAGVKLYFETDSRSLFLKAKVSFGSSRRYFSFDVMVDGKMIGCLRNYSDPSIPKLYMQDHPFGEFSQSFELGDGIKKVCIYMPWSVVVELKEISLEDNSCIKPIKPSKKLLAFGDSITQGHDAFYPSRRYVSRLAEALDAEEINKGIGGEMFFPALAESKDDFKSDLITVAYGTNDWGNETEEVFLDKCHGFFAALSKNYPDTPIYAITPIWRKDWMEIKDFGEFDKVAQDIKKIVEPFENITYINGFDFVPHDVNYFGDLFLHPNDSGFDQYFQNLYKQIGELIKCESAH